MINTGDRVKDRVLGFAGIVMAKTVFLNGCARCAVQPPVGKDGTMPKECWFDEPQLKVTKRNGVPRGKTDTGGPAYMTPTEKTTGKR